MGHYQAATLFEWIEEHAPWTESHLRACRSDNHERGDIKENGTLKPESKKWTLVIHATLKYAERGHQMT